MKVLYLFPLAFVADVYGLLIFVPYLALVLTSGYLLQLRQRAAAVALRAGKTEFHPAPALNLSQGLPSL